MGFVIITEPCSGLNEREPESLGVEQIQMVITGDEFFLPSVRDIVSFVHFLSEDKDVLFICSDLGLPGLDMMLDRFLQACRELSDEYPGRKFWVWPTGMIGPALAMTVRFAARQMLQGASMQETFDAIVSLRLRQVGILGPEGRSVLKGAGLIREEFWESFRTPRYTALTWSCGVMHSATTSNKLEHLARLIVEDLIEGDDPLWKSECQVRLNFGSMAQDMAMLVLANLRYRLPRLRIVGTDFMNPLLEMVFGRDVVLVSMTPDKKE